MKSSLNCPINIQNSDFPNHTTLQPLSSQAEILAFRARLSNVYKLHFARWCVLHAPAKNRLQTMDALCRNSLKLFKRKYNNKMKVHFERDNVPKLFGWFESEIELGYQDHSPRCYKHLLSLSIYDPFF